MTMNRTRRVITATALSLALESCSSAGGPPAPVPADAREIGRSATGDVLYVESDYLFGERVFLVERDGASANVGENTALFDYTVFGAISDSHLMWFVDDYDYPSDGAGHVVFFDRTTRAQTRWDFELAPDVFPRGFLIWEGNMAFCGARLRWTQPWGYGGSPTLLVDLSATGNLRWAAIDDGDASAGPPVCL